MGVCRYCNKRVRRTSATICKPCLDEVFRYEESVKWFEKTDMDKQEYYKEIIKITETPLIQKHFLLESNGLNTKISLLEGEKLLAVIKNVKYDKDVILEGSKKTLFKRDAEEKEWHIQRVKRDYGILFVTDRRLEFLGRYMKVTKYYAEIDKLEDYDGLGIAIPASSEVKDETIELSQYFYPFVDYKYLVKRAFDFEKHISRQIEGKQI